MTTKVYPRTEKVKLFLMAVEPQHSYSNEVERANFIKLYKIIYDYFKLKKTFSLRCFLQINSAL